MSATAILAAAGSGERLGAGEPKAFVELGGRPMVEWSLAALGEARSIDRVLVAVPPQTLPADGPGDGPGDASPPAPGGESAAERLAGAGRAAERLLGARATLVAGGPSRSESVANALGQVETEIVVVHDAARPLATAGLFDDVVATLAADGELAGVVAAAPVTDTTKEVLRGREVHRTLDRTSLWAAQTPQAFRTEALRRALGATELLAQASDDAMLVERSGGRVAVHPAPAENLKVTTEHELRIAEALLRERADA